jgi:type IV secretory pathway VirB10-like protein
MTATTFDVRAFNRHTGDIASALLGALDEHDLKKREEAVTEREADVSRRERAIDRLERKHALKGFAVQPAPAQVAAAAVVAPPAPTPAPEAEVQAAIMTTPEPTLAAMQPKATESRRLSFQDAFRLRELEWWTKVLGAVPTLP